MAYQEDNIFAKILTGDIPCEKLYEDDQLLAFYDIKPAAKVHILVIPKKPYQSYEDFIALSNDAYIARFMKTVAKIAQQAGLDKDGYRLVTNHGKNSRQEVPHFHIHILGGEQLRGPLN